MTIAVASDSFGLESLEIIILLFFYEAVAGRLLQVGRGRLFRTFLKTLKSAATNIR